MALSFGKDEDDKDQEAVMMNEKGPVKRTDESLLFVDTCGSWRGAEVSRIFLSSTTEKLDCKWYLEQWAGNLTRGESVNVESFSVLMILKAIISAHPLCTGTMQAAG